MSTTATTEIKHLTERIGTTVLRCRVQQGLGAKELAEKVGISRYTLSQIEKGISNPTMDTLWKIADGLNLPFASLMLLISNDESVDIKRSSELLEVKSPNSAFSISPLFSSNDPVSFDTYNGSLQPDSQYISHAHRKGVVELMTVIEGSVEVEFDDKTYVLEPRDSIKFRGDRIHIYRNPTQKIAHIHFVIYYEAGTQDSSVLFQSSEFKTDL